MAIYYAECYTPDNIDLDRRIQGLGGAGWWYNIDTIIHMIAMQGHTFYTRPFIGNGQLIVVAEHPRSRRPYLKTVADGVEPNNILSLPYCR